MEPTLVFAMLAATMSFLLFGATLLLLAMVGMFVWTARGRDRAALGGVTPVPAERTESPAETLAPANGAPAPGALLGFFDDESSVPGLGRAGLFGSGPVDLDDSEEGQATEIFSAHAASGDLAEFAMYEGDEATGRFSKGGEPR